MQKTCTKGEQNKISLGVKADLLVIEEAIKI